MGQPVLTLAYPYGDDQPHLRTAARGIGYRAAFGTRFGLNGRQTDAFGLRRVEVRGDDGLLAFFCKVRFGCSPRQLLWLSTRAWRAGREAAAME